jgi:hypothetical protein
MAMTFRGGNAAVEERGRPALRAAVPAVCGHGDAVLEFSGERRPAAEMGGGADSQMRRGRRIQLPTLLGLVHPWWGP